MPFSYKIQKMLISFHWEQIAAFCGVYSLKRLILGQNYLTKIHTVKVTVPTSFFMSLLCWWHKGVDQELHCNGNSPAVKRALFEVLTLYYRGRVGAKVSKLSLLQLGHTDMKEASRNMWLLKTKLRNSLWIVKSPHDQSFWSSSLLALQ